MDKKGIVFKSLIYWVIGLVVFFLIVYFFFLSPQGLNAITKLGVKFGLSKLPIKPEEKIKEIEEIPNNVKTSFYDLVNAIKDGKENENSNCLIKYETFPDEIKDFNINLKEIEKGLSFTVYNKLGQLRLQETIQDLETCYHDDRLRRYSSDNIIINKEDEINVGKDIDYEDVTILGVNYKLLYKDSSNNICFLTDCGNDCLRLLIKNKIEFCDGSFKDIFKDVFYQNTYYGDIENWESRKYTGNDPRVPFKYTIDGISKNQYNNVFDLEKINDENHKENSNFGVWYKGKYYGIKEDWCFVLELYGKEWHYTGKETVDENIIQPNLKRELFGHPEYPIGEKLKELECKEVKTK